MTQRLVFLGPPGAGKGTQAKLLAAEKSLIHISTGDMLRGAVTSGSELGKQVKAVIDSGQLVSDELMISIIEDRISQDDCKSGYVLDGFPRTVLQAQALEDLLKKRGESLAHVVLFDISEDELLRRLAHRRSVEGRVDDNEATQRERLKVYAESTLPLIAFYESLGLLRRVAALSSVEEVQANLSRAIAGEFRE